MKKTNTTAKKNKKIQKVSNLVGQFSEPFSLLNTLKEEGMANLFTFAQKASDIATTASKNLEMLKPSIREVVLSFGFAYKEDLERLEARVEELEDKISELDLKKVQNEFGDEE